MKKRNRNSEVASTTWLYYNSIVNIEWINNKNTKKTACEERALYRFYMFSMDTT